jgi:hypothetical protein
MRLDETALAFPVGRSEAKRRAIHYRRERRRWRSVHPIVLNVKPWARRHGA